MTHIAQNVPKNPAVLPLGTRLARLCIALSVLWFVVYVLAPLPVEHFPPLRQFSNSIKANNISPGAVYYTDVPDAADAEIHNRSTVRYYGTRKE